MALFALADVSARLGAATYNRLFAKSGGASADATFAALCVSETESLVRSWTRAAFPDGFDAAGGTVDVAIVGYCVDVCTWVAAKRHPSASEMSGYFIAYKEAKSFFQALNRDHDARPVTANTGRAKPRAAVYNATDSAGEVTNPFQRAANKQDSSDF